jgi:predicted Zn-ribbon and HTH transcriptional regulator
MTTKSNSSSGEQQRPTITLEPPWWRCENGSEFRSGSNKPARCPVCESTNIEMVTEVEPVFVTEAQRRTGR